MTEPPPTNPQGASDRLESWKEVAAYLRRDVTTVQRWEKREGMPVHRHLHDKLGTVYAFRSELEAWSRSRRLLLGAPDEGESAGSPSEDPPAPSIPLEAEAQLPAAPSAERIARPRRPPAGWVLGGFAAALALALGVGLALRGPPGLSSARFLRLTDFDGSQQAAAISRDGRFAAFLSDRDGRMDVWVTQIGTGQFINLTRGRAPELVNPSVRALGFSPDGTLVTFWGRRPQEPGAQGIGVWAVPLLGGPPRPYLEGVAEFDWSSDGTRLVFHTPEPGDPMSVREPGAPPEGRKVFTAGAGLHAHFPLWSPDQAAIYFVQGALPDHLDLWRLSLAGGQPERLTHHDSSVSYPVFLDARTLLYLATDGDGSGPWMYTFDLHDGLSRRFGGGLEAYTSLAASADGRRLVATLATPKILLWSVALSGEKAQVSAARRLPLTTGSGWSARWGPDALFYVSSKGASDSLWRLQDGSGTELWSKPGARIIGAPAIARDGRRIALSVREGDQLLLYVVNSDGTNARAVTRALELQGSPAWAPDGQAVTVAVVRDGVPMLFTVPMDGRPPLPLLGEYSVEPVWNPAGDVVLYSGADVGTTFPVKAARADGAAFPLPALQFSRGARHLAFMPGGRALLALRGEIRHKNLWRIDLDTGAEQQVTEVPADFNLRDFDLSPDGQVVVLEQVQEQSDIVLIDVPAR